MMRGRMKPSVMPTMVQIVKQIAKVSQMTSPQEGQLKEQKEEVPHMTIPLEKQLRGRGRKLNGIMTQGFQRVRNAYNLMGMCMKIGCRLMQVHNISSIQNNIDTSNNNRHRKVYKLLTCKWKEWRHNLLLQCLNHHNYMYLLVDQDLQRDFHFNLSLGANWCKRQGHLQRDPKILQHIQVHQSLWRRQLQK